LGSLSGTGKQIAESHERNRPCSLRIAQISLHLPRHGEIRRLDATETTRRRKIVRTAKEAARQLAKIDVEALQELDPATRAELLRRLREAGDEDQ